MALFSSVKLEFELYLLWKFFGGLGGFGSFGCFAFGILGVLGGLGGLGFFGGFEGGNTGNRPKDFFLHYRAVCSNICKDAGFNK